MRRTLGGIGPVRRRSVRWQATASQWLYLIIILCIIKLCAIRQAHDPDSGTQPPRCFPCSIADGLERWRKVIHLRLRIVTLFSRHGAPPHCQGVTGFWHTAPSSPWSVGQGHVTPDRRIGPGTIRKFTGIDRIFSVQCCLSLPGVAPTPGNPFSRILCGKT